jgi:hypothetical protein
MSGNRSGTNGVPAITSSAQSAALLVAPIVCNLRSVPLRAPAVTSGQPSGLFRSPGARSRDRPATKLAAPAISRQQSVSPGAAERTWRHRVGSHASFIRAYRQVTGGTAEAGVSAATTVSVVDFSPLTAGATYQLWVVGVNSRGEGPESNKITFTA